jgi:hypothetical protein
LNLTREERQALGITTIRAAGDTDADVEQQRKQRKADRKRASRREAGAMPRDQYEATSAARTKPWAAFGISRRTWERRGKQIPPAPDASVGQPVQR